MGCIVRKKLRDFASPSSIPCCTGDHGQVNIAKQRNKSCEVKVENKFSTGFPPALLPMSGRSETVAEWLVLGGSVAFTHGSAGQWRHAGPCRGPWGCSAAWASTPHGPEPHDLYRFVHCLLIEQLFSTYKDFEHHWEKVNPNHTGDSGVFLMCEPHWRLFDCGSTRRSDAGGVPAVWGPASVQGLTRKRKMKRWQPLSAQTSRCVRETSVQASHCRAASFLCDCLGARGSTLEEAEFPGKFRRKLAGCRKGSSSNDTEAWSHSMWLWVFKTVSHGWDTGHEVGGVETETLIWFSESSGELSTFCFTLPAAWAAEMQLEALISPGFL